MWSCASDEKKRQKKKPSHVNDMTRRKKDRWLRFGDWTHIHNDTCQGCQRSQQALMRTWQWCVSSQFNYWLKYIHVFGSHFTFWFCRHEAFWNNTAANPRPSVPDMWWILILYTAHSHMRTKQETSWCASAASLRTSCKFHVSSISFNSSIWGIFSSSNSDYLTIQDKSFRLVFCNCFLKYAQTVGGHH